MYKIKLLLFLLISNYSLNASILFHDTGLNSTLRKTLQVDSPNTLGEHKWSAEYSFTFIISL